MLFLIYQTWRKTAERRTYQFTMCLLLSGIIYVALNPKVAPIQCAYCFQELFILRLIPRWLRGIHCEHSLTAWYETNSCKELVVMVTNVTWSEVRGYGSLEEIFIALEFLIHQNYYWMRIINTLELILR